MLLVSCFASIVVLISKLKAEQDDHNLSSPAPNASECKSSYVIVSTVDGKLSCLNTHTGNLKWVVPTKRLLSSSISSIKSIKDLTGTRLIPSLDGRLFKWNGENIEGIPLSVDYLLGKLQKLPDGSFVVGSKEIVLSGIDVNTGQNVFDCTSTGCQTKHHNDKIQDKDVLSLRRVQNTVRVVDPRTGAEKWNFSVGYLDIEFLDGLANEIPDPSTCQPSSVQDLNFNIQDGILSCEGVVNWSVQFPSPIAHSWMLEDGLLYPIDVFKQGLLQGFSQEELPPSWMYMGLHEGQIYIQNPTFKRELQVMTHPQLKDWRPYIASSPSRTPALNNKLHELQTLDYPFDNGFILVRNETPVKTLQVVKDQCLESVENQCSSSSNVHVDVGSKDNNIIPLSIKDWWKEIVALSIVISIVVNVTIRVLKKNVPALNKIEPQIGDSEKAVTILENKPPKVIRSADRLEDKMRKSISEQSIDANGEYVSRYIFDFEHVQCLGKGGFGVVFKAKKRIDDREYAIKRIYLPSCDEAKEKMMREVKALAALDHPGIVRYFHAWWEAPPMDWQMEMDKTLLQGSEEPSYTFSNDWAVEVNANVPKEEKGKAREKSLGEDPLGKRYNFETGAIEEIISNHKGFDLFAHNDVFYEEATNENSFFDSQESSREVVSRTSSCDVDESSRERYSTLTNGNENSDSSRSDCEKRLCCDSYILCSSERSDSIVFQSSDSSNDFANDKSTDLIVFQEEKVSSAKKTNERTSRRVVGKCCTRSSTCLTRPPLFLYIQMQLCQHATLKDWLATKANVTLSQAMHIFMQIVNAVEYFHGLGMMHRDLKPANIFFSLDGSIKVGDFGLVTVITQPSDGIHKDLKADEKHTGQVGTQMYMSPEQVRGEAYTHKVDVYSLGLILFELLCSFSTQMERIKSIYLLKSGTLPPDLQDSPQGKLVQLLTAHDQLLRPEAHDIKNLEYTCDIKRSLSPD